MRVCRRPRKLADRVLSLATPFPLLERVLEDVLGRAEVKNTLPEQAQQNRIHNQANNPNDKKTAKVEADARQSACSGARYQHNDTRAAGKLLETDRLVFLSEE